MHIVLIYQFLNYFERKREDWVNPNNVYGPESCRGNTEQ